MPQRIFVVDAVHARALGDDLAWISSARSVAAVSVEKIRIGSAGGEEHDAAFFKMPDGAAADVRLGHLMHLDGGHDARGRAGIFQRVLQRQRVDHGGQHAHVVRRYAIHVHGGRRHAPKEIAAAYHQPDLNACSGHLGDLFGQASDPLRIDAEARAAGQHFAAQLQNDALVLRHAPARYSLGGDWSAVSSISAASPTLKRTNRETEMFSPTLAIMVLIRSPTVVEFSRMKGCS